MVVKRGQYRGNVRHCRRCTVSRPLPPRNADGLVPQPAMSVLDFAQIALGLYRTSRTQVGACGLPVPDCASLQVAYGATHVLCDVRYWHGGLCSTELAYGAMG
eukprot:1622088-Rhodomonas_salina.2